MYKSFRILQYILQKVVITINNTVWIRSEKEKLLDSWKNCKRKYPLNYKRKSLDNQPFLRKVHFYGILLFRKLNRITVFFVYDIYFFPKNKKQIYN